MLLLQLIGAAALCWLIIIIPAHGAFNDSRPVISTTSNDSRNPRQRISFANTLEDVRIIEGRSPSRLGPLTPQVEDESNDVLSGRFFRRPAMHRGQPTGNSNGNRFYSKMRNVNPLSNFMPCVSTNAEEMGICLLAPVCTYYGGRSTGGDCRMGLTCCVNEITSCGPLITFNNTYWQSPAVISSESSCGLTVKLDQYLMEQRKPVCQIRLDFQAFSLAQPNTESVCNIDSFQVAGALNKIPIICGDANGQHMYLMLPRVSTSVQLVMTLGTSSSPRYWRIKIAMLPCDSEFLAPEDCLQYFTTSTGSIMTFNWMDTTSRATRQLASQDYYICFRTELVNRQSSGQVATMLCLSHCQVANGQPFSLSGRVEARSQRLESSSCANDYVVFPGGFSFPMTEPVNQRDRFCGTLLSQMDEADTQQTICSTAKPFRLLYRTNGDESITPVVDANPLLGNQGFCLKYEQKFNLEIDRPLENED
ncbi:uncharacterized protein LOC124316262 isoform X3 [Daphnia pulicaria]|uniref:uncharacterized protein LOC124316262 isoform X3 n=1 Tax=Daphnia pulicaria TaxID=35523 RepID=UPI001EEA2E9F|nr:uncharacterized protein LOC124316262 isoform X3 [Daphnia pulicaria]